MQFFFFLSPLSPGYSVNHTKSPDTNHRDNFSDFLFLDHPVCHVHNSTSRPMQSNFLPSSSHPVSHTQLF